MTPATLTPERTEAAPAEPLRAPTPEKPVFAATSDARPRALKLVGRIAAGLVGLWLLALVLGAFGLGHIPGPRLPQLVGKQDTKPASDAHRAAAKLAERRAAAAKLAPPTSASVPGRRLTSGPAGGIRHGATPTTTRVGGGPGAGPNHTGSSSTGGQTSGGATSHTPAASSSPGAQAPAPAGTTATTQPSTNASPNATPPGPSSTSPGSRSHSGTAPGRDTSTASPTPGSGSTDHGRPTG